MLSLEFDENFCMGGPGIIMSRETLRRVAPHIPTCLKNLYSTHEDVEVGRCVQKFAGIPCTWNYEVKNVLLSLSFSYGGQHLILSYESKMYQRQYFNDANFHFSRCSQYYITIPAAKMHLAVT